LVSQNDVSHNIG